MDSARNSEMGNVASHTAGQSAVAEDMAVSRLYRPSNGSEGDGFMSRWCEKCVKDSESKPCRILGRTMAFSVDDKLYPREWIEDDNGPRCTAFSDHVKPPLSIVRDKRQIALPGIRP